MATDKNIIIVGAGHNGLVAAGYLARAGLNVQVLERPGHCRWRRNHRGVVPGLPDLHLLIHLPHASEEGHR